MKRLKEILGIIGLLASMIILGTIMSKAATAAMRLFW